MLMREWMTRLKAAGVERVTVQRCERQKSWQVEADVGSTRVATLSNDVIKGMTDLLDTVEQMRGRKEAHA